MAKKKVIALYSRVVRHHGRIWVEDPVEVRVMAMAEGYAMVRHPGCMPFIVSDREIELKK